MGRRIMQRPYETGTESDVDFFIGNEVEKTPAYGLRTLFVTGVHDGQEIESRFVLNNCQHIFFGANHSFYPETPEEWNDWESMIVPFLKAGVLCSLDIPIFVVDTFNESPFNEYDNFIPQIRIPLPYMRLWNYNTMIKIDDIGFNQTNPGVWCHSLHSLTDRSVFTDWAQYNNDKILP